MTSRCVWLCVGVAYLLCLAGAMPARRSPAPDLAARRRSATERNFIRFGRSYHELEPEDERHVRSARTRQDNIIRLGRSDNFLRFGRSQPLAISQEELLDLVRPTEEDYERYLSAKRRNNNFVRLGRREDSFLRYGKSLDQYPGIEVNGELTLVRHEPLRNESLLRQTRSGSPESSEGLNETYDDEEKRF